jgi:hypothetical protein
MLFRRSPLAPLLVAALAAAAIATSPPVPASAFDTGPHASITIDAVMAAGLNRNAANVVQVENWLTDYYTSSPTAGSTERCDLDKLHFDDLFSTNDIEAYWLNLQTNTRNAAAKAEQDGDVLEFYVVLGMSLHVVQDFYSHSNWIDQNGVSVQPGHYSTKTWFQTPSPKPTGLHTGWYDNCLHIPQDGHEPHGDDKSGLNHDSVVRAGYDRAYVYAYAASYEWAKNVLDWLGPAFRAKVLNYSPNSSDLNDLTIDQNASLYISEWISTPSADGHWNGTHSGYAAAFAGITAAWTGRHDSIFVSKFKSAQIYSTLSKNQYTGRGSSSWPITPYPIRGTIFAMRTLSVYANSAITGTDSYFGTLSALNWYNANYAYRDAAQHHMPRTNVPWLQLIYVPASRPVTSVTFRYTLWNEFATTNNDPVPIKGSKTTLTFSCPPMLDAPCAGDISGGPWTESNPYATKGDGTDGVMVKLFFTSSPAAP